MQTVPSKCVYGKRAVASSSDHVVPRYHGGPDGSWNRVPVCIWCNRMLSCCLLASDGDTIGMLRWKKEQFLRSCWATLKRNWRWRLLSKEDHWNWVRRGAWFQFLPNHLQKRYHDGCGCSPGRLVGKGKSARWKFYRVKRASASKVN